MQKDFPKYQTDKCQCDYCTQGAEAMALKEARCLKMFGFFTHYVEPAPGSPNDINIHTHGVQQSFGHYDFQICVPVSPETAFHVMNTLVARVRNSEKFEVNKDYEDIGDGFTSRFIFAREGGRTVLRLCIPNEENVFEGKVYEDQFKMVNY